VLAVVVDVALVGFGLAPTARAPFTPEAAWPGTVRRWLNRPFVLKVTVSFADLPGLINGAFLPLIEKACAILPRGRHDGDR
jgi:hypothetical protein